MSYIREIQFGIVDNFIKCELYPDSPEVELWWMEIDYWLGLIDRKIFRYQLSSKVLFDIMFNEPIETVEELEDQVIIIGSMNSLEQTPVESTILHRRLKAIIGKICESLGQRKYTTLGDFYEPRFIRLTREKHGEEFTKRLELLKWYKSLDHADSTGN